MKQNLRILFLLIFCIVNKTFYAQKISKVKKSDFNFAAHSLDSLAGASFVFSTLKIEYFSGDQVEAILNFHERIRIHNKEGLDYANYVIDLFNDGEYYEELNRVKAVTYNIVDGKVKKTKLEKSKILKEDISERHTIKSFELPNVRVGSIIDVTYEIVTPFIFETPMFYFQHYIPVDYALFQISTPLFMKYTPIVRGSTTLKQYEKEKTVGGEPVIVTKMSASNLPPIVPDNYVLNINDYRSGLKYEMDFIDWENRQKDHAKISWDSIGRDIYNTHEYKTILESDIKSADLFLSEISLKTPLEKCKLIYDYVRSNYLNNGNVNNYLDNTILDLEKQNKGSIAELNLLLINLLRKAEIDVHPLVGKNRSQGLINTAFPSLSELNYLIAFVNIDDKKFALDASSKLHPFGILPYEAIFHFGLLVKEKDSKIIGVDNPNKYLSLRVATYDMAIENGHLEGEGESSFNDFASVKYRLKIKGEDADRQRIEEVESHFNANSNDVMFFKQMSNLERLSRKIKYEFSEKKFNAFENIGDKILLNADLNLGLAQNPFTSLQRSKPVFYNSKLELRNISYVNIPEGYVVESLPEKLILSLPNGDGNYAYEAEIKKSNEGKNQVFISQTFKINKTVFIADEYPTLREFYKLIFEKSTDKIIFKKRS